MNNINMIPASAEVAETFSITYDYKTVDGSTLPSDVTLDFIFGKMPKIVNAGGALSFDVEIPYLYTAEVALYDEDNNVIYLTGKRMDLPDSDREHYIVNDGWPLGTEPVYTSINTTDLNQGPSKYRRTASFFVDNLDSNKTIIVEISQRTEPCYYDMHWALSRPNLSGRGSSGSDINHLGGTLWPNIVTEDSWGWNSTNGCFKDDPRKLSGNLLNLYNTHWYREEDSSSYTLDWIFQTNSGNFIFNSFGINGVAITPPFVPEEIWEGNTKLGGDGEGSAGTFVRTVINDAEVRIRYVRTFNRQTQRIYWVTITGAQCNMNVTAGNLMQGDSGSPEFVFGQILGVSADGIGEQTVELYVANEWRSVEANEIQTTADLGAFLGDPALYGANFRFKLLPGYENPVFTLVNLMKNQIVETNQNEINTFDFNKYITWNEIENNLNDAGKLKQNYLYGPDEDGFYYLKVHDMPDPNNKIFELNIVATSLKYIMRYMVGYHYDKITNIPGTIHNGLFIPATPDNMPVFDPKKNTWDDERSKLDYIDDRRIERYDDNNGKFYDTIENTNITIPDNIPIDLSNEKEFQRWIIVDSDETPIEQNNQTIDLYPNDSIRLEDYIDYMNILDTELGGNENNYFVLRLKSVWENK